jgi:hypothetical protein
MALILRNHQNCVVTRKARNDGICWQKIMGYEFLFDIYHIMTAKFYLFMNFYSRFFFFAIKKPATFGMKEVHSVNSKTSLTGRYLRVS